MLTGTGPVWLNELGRCIYKPITKTAWSCQWSVVLFGGFSTTKTGGHDIAKILLKVALKHQQSKSNQIPMLTMHTGEECRSVEGPYLVVSNNLLHLLDPHRQADMMKK